MTKLIVTVVFFILLSLVNKMTHEMPEGKEHIPLQIFWTFIFGIAITSLLYIPVNLLEKHFVGSEVWGNHQYDKKTDPGYSLVNDSTKPWGESYFQRGDSIYYEYLVYDKTGEVISGDSSFYRISLKKYGDYLLAECLQDRDEEGMVVDVAMLFQNGELIFEKTFCEPFYFKRVIDFYSENYFYTYTYSHDHFLDHEYYHYDGSEASFFESLFVDEDNKVWLILSLLFLGMIAGYYFARMYVRHQ